MASDFLMVCEQFYSIQGEGVQAGVPAVFLRLAGCNLQCPGFSYRDPETGELLGCDTKAVWRKGQRQSIDQILADWQQQGWLQALQAGAHVVITGGEPLLQQAGVVAFIEQLRQQLSTASVFIELETNASRALQPGFIDHFQQINASPKLASSGEARAQRYHKETLATLAASAHSYFKFVVTQPADVDEIITDFVAPLGLMPGHVLLMPEGGSRQALADKAPWVVELCKQHGFRYSPRLQVTIWGEVTGV